MSIINGLKELTSKLSQLIPTLRQIITGNGSEQDDESAGKIVLKAIEFSIDQVGLNEYSGQLKRSFSIVSISAGTIIISSNLRYASYLNYGTAPSFGRYVPSLGKGQGKGKRIKDENVPGAGMHKGNRPYNFMEMAEKIAMERISRQSNTWVQRALQTIGLA
jgi:hypothetical protein